LRSLQLSRFQQ